MEIARILNAIFEFSRFRLLLHEWKQKSEKQIKNERTVKKLP